MYQRAYARARVCVCVCVCMCVCAFCTPSIEVGLAGVAPSPSIVKLPTHMVNHLSLLLQTVYGIDTCYAALGMCARMDLASLFKCDNGVCIFAMSPGIAPIFKEKNENISCSKIIVITLAITCYDTLSTGGPSNLQRSPHKKVDALNIKFYNVKINLR